MSDARILVRDDHDLIRRLLRGTLEHDTLTAAVRTLLARSGDR